MRGLMMALAGLVLWGGAARGQYSLTVESLSNFGGPGYAPLVGDYDGDGQLDPTVYQAEGGHWYFALSGSGYALEYSNLGVAGGVGVSADFDGDGRADPAVYQTATGNWYARLSGSNYEIFWQPGFGGPGFVPVPGDYDGRGLAAMALYQPESATWYRLRIEPAETTNLDALAVMYSNAMVNASNVTPAKIRRDLTPITPGTPGLVWRVNPASGVREVLVISFMPWAVATNYYHPGQTSSLQYAESWVTLAPDVKNVCRRYTGGNLCLRLKQMLGLPATAANDAVVEFFADPRLLLRPARDPEITDRETETAFRTNAPYVSVSTNYLAWFQRTIESRNYGMTDGVWNAWPWTQLGYTYDWAKTGSDVAGFSEFVLPGRMLKNEFGIDARVYVVTVTRAAHYAAAPDNRALQSTGGAVHVARHPDR